MSPFLQGFDKKLGIEKSLKLCVCLVKGDNFWASFFDLSSQPVKYCDWFNFSALGVAG